MIGKRAFGRFQLCQEPDFWPNVLVDISITPMREAAWAFSIFWMYTVLVERTISGMDRRNLLSSLAACKIQARPLWQPAHLSKAHKDAVMLGCPVAESLYDKAISLPCSVALQIEKQQFVIHSIKNILRIGQ